MKKNKKFLFIILFATMFMAIGYATVNNVNLSIMGASSAADNGDIKIKSVTLTDYNKLTNPEGAVNSFTDDNINFDLNFNVTNSDLQNGESFYATFKIVMENDSISDYIFGSTLFTPSVETQTNPNMTIVPELIDIALGDTIPAKTEVEFYLTIHVYPTQQGNYNVSGESEMSGTEVNDGIIVGSITGNNTGNLQGDNNIVGFTASVMNTYTAAKTFTFSISNNNFIITDSNGNALGNYVINAEDTQDFNFYIMKSNNASFLSSTQKVNINIVPVGDSSSSIGIVTLTVDVNVSVDATPPQVSGVTSTIQSTTGSVQVSWAGSDNIAIDYYKVEVYDSTDTFIKDQRTVADENSLVITGLNPGTYYFVVTAYDTSQNTATAQSNQKEFKWVFTVTYHLTNAATTGSNSDTVSYGNTYQVTLSGSNSDYNAPATVTVTMGGSTPDRYNYDSSSGVLTIYNVIGDLEITASGTEAGGNTPCLVEGTKFLMADGSTKNIEDIYYDDLIMVYSHETGEFVGEYPIWIESGKTTTSYLLSTFSDGETLKTVGKHTVFSLDNNEFVDVTNPEKYHVGTRIYKIKSTNTGYELVEVTVEKIETIHETVKYYDVVSTRYYNAITDNVLTSDGREYLPNFYLFKENALWSDRRQEVLENNIQVPYEMVNYMPYYLYRGLRAMDGAVLVHYGYITYDDFRNIFELLLMNPIMQLPPQTNASGDRVWMVTTSLDNVTEENKNDFLVIEGSTIQLPQTNKRWYSTAENVYYDSEAYVEVWHGMHFIEK